MKIIAGLGNPGKKYKFSRHNLGFLVLNSFLKKNNFPAFKSSKKTKSLIAKGFFGKESIILAKPQAFMNDSGKAAKLLLSHFKIPVSKLIVIQDDVDLNLGEIKIVKNRGAAGHKGILSIIKELKTENFIRLRIGIKPKDKKGDFLKTFVLKNFTEEEKKIIKKSVKKCLKAIELLLKEGLEKAMNEFN